MVNSKNVIKFLGTLRNLMSFSIGGGRAEQKAVRKLYQVRGVSFGGNSNDNDTCTFTLQMVIVDV